MKTLLTGHKGFIGRNITEKIKVYTTGINILDYEGLRDFVIENKIDSVVHCAVKPDDVYDNIVMLANILKLPVKRIITFGSGCQFYPYPKSPKYKLFKELQSKMVGADKRVINLVLYGVYGKYENIKETFISSSIIRAIKGKKIIVKDDKIFDYVYVDDIVRIVKYFLKANGGPKEYDVTDESISLSDIARLISSDYSIKNDSCSAYIGNPFPIKFKFTPVEEGISKLRAYYEKTIGSSKH